MEREKAAHPTSVEHYLRVMNRGETPALGTEIHRFKIALTSDCPQRCGYCCIDKNDSRTLTVELAERAVELFLRSPGRVKNLYLYGGEPFLRFGELKGAVVYARREAERLDKHLAILVSTGGTCLSDDQLFFLRDADVGLCFSLDGKPETQDRYRRLKGGKSSFGRVVKNVERAFAALGVPKVGVSQGVHPETVSGLFDNYRFLTSLGFQNTNLEIIQGVPWTPENKRELSENLRRQKDFLLWNIERCRFLFPLSVCEFAVSFGNPAFSMCPFHSSFEVFPDGHYSFYPYPFLREQEVASVSLGTVESGLGRYQDCRFDAGSDGCRDCARTYYSLERFPDGDPVILRNRAALSTLTDILELSRTSRVHSEYLRESVRRSYSGFG